MGLRAQGLVLYTVLQSGEGEMPTQQKSQLEAQRHGHIILGIFPWNLPFLLSCVQLIARSVVQAQTGSAVQRPTCLRQRRGFSQPPSERTPSQNTGALGGESAS